MGNVTAPLDNTIREGINVINGPNGLISVVRDAQSGIVTMYQSTLSGVKEVFKDSEQNFFRVGNNLIQNISNIAYDAEKGIIRDFRAVQKDIVTLLDDTQDNLNENFRLLLFNITNTIQYVISLGFLAFILIFLLFGKEIFEMVKHVIQNGVKITF